MNIGAGKIIKSGDIALQVLPPNLDIEHIAWTNSSLITGIEFLFLEASYLILLSELIYPPSTMYVENYIFADLVRNGDYSFMPSWLKWKNYRPSLQLFGYKLLYLRLLLFILSIFFMLVMFHRR